MIRTLSKTSENGEEFCLYHLVAGSLHDEDENTCAPSVSTTESHILYDFIEQRSPIDLLNAGVPSDKIKSLLREGPSFIVTDFMPDIDSLSSSMPTILPSISTKAGKQVYEYHHKADKSICICIHEPRSPPRTEYKRNGKTETSATMKQTEVSLRSQLSHFHDIIS